MTLHHLFAWAGAFVFAATLAAGLLVRRNCSGPLSLGRQDIDPLDILEDP